MTEETTALLIGARSFIERGWCRSVFALDRYGHGIEPTSEYAVAWCMLGALRAAGWSDDADHPALTLLREAAGDAYLVKFNDRQKTVKPILAVFDRAIGLANQGDELP
jgi:hypothetical protein